MNHQQVLDLFVDQNVLQKTQADDVLTEAQQNGKTIVQAMVDGGFMDESGFYRTVAEGIGAQFIDLNDHEIPPAVVKLVPAGLARLHRALPVDLVDNTLRVALADPLESRTEEDLRFALGRDIEVVVAPVEQIEDRIRIFYGSDTSSMDEVLKQLGEVGELMQLREGDGAGGAEAEANATPIIRFVDLILYQAIQDRASDIHFEPFENEFKIRYRVDGALYEMAPPPRHLALPVISRVKVMASMNIAERRLPQDGRIQKNIAGRNVDLRVSTLPTQFGESVVLRVLDRSTVNLDLDMLGMPKYVYDYIHEVIERPNGIFIVTGPTGSDRIMVGETRDLETAQIAIQASLTGHLVFTTLHTNDAPGAITRLIDMGVEPFLISSTLEAVLGQRLLRSICSNCRTSYEPNANTLDQLGLSRRELGEKKFYYGKGCDTCNKTGYKGRKGIYELMRISDPLRELINERPPTVTLKQKAIELGMITLRQDGLRSVFDGDTTVEEVLKYT